MQLAICRFDSPLGAVQRVAVRVVLAILALFSFTLAHADVRCVSTVGDLTSAIADANAGAEGGTWDIRVRPGTYQLSDDLTFNPAGDHDNKLLYLSGGWNAGCSAQTGHASGSIVRGLASIGSNKGTSFNFLGNNARYDIENIRFENFYIFTVYDPPCLPYNICPGTAAVVVDHSEFDNAELVTVVTYDSPFVVFRNNLVTNITPINVGYSPIDLEFKQNGYIDISFNTLAQLTCLSTNGGLAILAGNPNARLHHNIVQTSDCNHDVYIDTTYGGQMLAPWHNLFLSIANYTGNLADQGNVIDFNPKFVDAANGNFRLQNASSAVNTGMTLLGSVQMGFFGPPLDLDGHLRPTGLHYDIGAYESLVDDGAPALITVTNASDADDGTCNSDCSLREAINKANAQVGTAQEIVFNIPGSCPQTILLNSALPDVTDPLYINAYSQPGAAPNDLDVGTDASVCVLIAPAGAGLTHALQVPAGQPDETQLLVSGIGFGTSFFAFSGAAIELRAGAGHVVSGNVFGGVLPNDGNTSLNSLERGVLVRGTAKNVRIGGDQNASRNTFGAMNNNAIVITDATTSGHVIKNNYIGLTPNGLNAQPNAADGISATGGTNVSILDNVIDASVHGIYISGASTTGFTVQGNRIGVNAIGIGIAADANDIGIQVAGGSGQHTIGFAPGENFDAGTFSNDIRSNNTAGINLASSAGSYISIRGNRLEANGRDGIGLGIDLGALGALANDAADPDSGPNTLQNHPIIKLSSPNGATRQITAALNTSADQALRIDFYRSPLCPKGATGANATTFVGSVDVNSGVYGVLKTFSAQVATSGAPAYLTATATTDVGNTSELAPCFAEDTIFADSVESPGL